MRNWKTNPISCSPFIQHQNSSNLARAGFRSGPHAGGSRQSVASMKVPGFGRAQIPILAELLESLGDNFVAVLRRTVVGHDEAPRLTPAGGGE